MTEEEEAFIQGHEFAIDYRLDGVTEEDVKRYDQLTQKRWREEQAAGKSFEKGV